MWLGFKFNVAAEVHPDIHNKNLAAEIEGPPLELSELHAKMRREGYRVARKHLR